MSPSRRDMLCGGLIGLAALPIEGAGLAQQEQIPAKQREPRAESGGRAASVLEFIPREYHAAIALQTSEIDLTSYFQVAFASGVGLLEIPPGRYIVGDKRRQLLLPSGLVIIGTPGQSVIVAHESFSTSARSEDEYRFLLYADGKHNISVVGLSFELSAPSAVQSKLGFKNSTQISIQRCSFQENMTCDLLFNACSDFEIDNCRFDCGVSGVNQGVGARICGKSKRFVVRSSYFGGAHVTQRQQGGGRQPAGDRWASVGLNIDCAQQNHRNSTEFKGGTYRFVSDGSGRDLVLPIPGVNSAEWLAWAEQIIETDSFSNKARRDVSVEVADGSITITGLPQHSQLPYILQYAFFGHTPEDGLVQGCEFIGCTYAGLSIINGLRIRSRDNLFQHCGDVALDPEGALSISSKGDLFDDCNTAAICTGYGAEFDSTVRDWESYGISMNCDSGAAYQAFGVRGSDYWSSQLENSSIDVSPSSDHDQLLTGSLGCFRAVNVGDHLRIRHSGGEQEYPVIEKVSDDSITVDPSRGRDGANPQAPALTGPIPSGRYSSGSWRKSSYSPALLGLQGNVSIRGTFTSQRLPQGPALTCRYATDTTIAIEQISGVEKAVEIVDSRNATINGGTLSGRLLFQRVTGLHVTGVTIARSRQRGLVLDDVQNFQLSRLLFHDNVDGNAGSPGILFGRCQRGVISDILLVLPIGDSANQQPTVIEGTLDTATNKLKIGNSVNEDIDVRAISEMRSGSVASEIVGTFPDGATAPSVMVGGLFQTANRRATQIGRFTGMIVGKRFAIVAGDSNTALIGGALLRLKQGAILRLGQGQGVGFVCVEAGIATEI